MPGASSGRPGGGREKSQINLGKTEDPTSDHIDHPVRSQRCTMVDAAKQGTKRITLSVIKADIGGWVGHSAIHPALVDRASECLVAAKTSGLLLDYHVAACGD